MQPRFLLLMFLMSCGGFLGVLHQSSVLSEEPSNAALADASGIRQLVAQLGHAQYLLRQQAETQLLQRGVEAQAELQAAKLHADLEIATRAKYILNQIRIEWVRSYDSPAVRSIMAHYREQPPQSRLAKIGQLAALDEQQGFGALCRIARFDASSRVAPFAALAILEQGFLTSEQTPPALAMLAKEMPQKIVDSDPDPMQWIRLYLDQLQAPQAIDARWLELIDAQLESLEEESVDGERSQVATLLLCHLNLCDHLSDATGIFAGLQRSVALSLQRDQSVEKSLAAVLKWLLDRKQWEALTLVEGHYAETIQNERLLCYLVAVARGRQGRVDESERLATEAYQKEFFEDSLSKEERKEFLSEDAQTRFRIAEAIADLGRHDWAEREWRQVIAALPATDSTALLARQSVGVFCLNDRGQNEAAAKLLGETIDAINDNPAIRSLYRGDGKLRLLLDGFRSNHEYFLACHFESTGEYEKQQQHLDRACKFDRDNADVLIAMYHLKNASSTYQKNTREKIAQVKKELKSKIRLQPGYANWYNHWAWLVSNTEGDFAKAVEYSKRSLKLEPESASYLDTLGRCYYAAGDIKNAVRVQRQAVATYPHLRVMRRQLKLFESELSADSAK